MTFILTLICFAYIITSTIFGALFLDKHFLSRSSKLDWRPSQKITFIYCIPGILILCPFILVLWLFHKTWIYIDKADEKFLNKRAQKRNN